MSKIDLVAYFKMEGSRVGIKIEDSLRKENQFIANVDLDNIDEYIASFNEVMAKVKNTLSNES